MRIRSTAMNCWAIFSCPNGQEAKSEMVESSIAPQIIHHSISIAAIGVQEAAEIETIQKLYSFLTKRRVVDSPGEWR